MASTPASTPPSRSFLVVLGADAHSAEQLRVCQAKRPPHVRGAIRCDDEANSAAPVCTQVPAFPSFCDEETKECTVGLRRTDAELEALLTLPTRQHRPAPNAA